MYHHGASTGIWEVAELNCCNLVFPFGRPLRLMLELRHEICPCHIGGWRSNLTGGENIRALHSYLLSMSSQGKHHNQWSYRCYHYLTASPQILHILSAGLGRTPRGLWTKTLRVVAFFVTDIRFWIWRPAETRCMRLLSLLTMKTGTPVHLVSHYSAIGDTISCDAPYSAIGFRGKFFPAMPPLVGSVFGMR